MSDQKNEQEEEFFHRQDQEKLRKLREAAEREEQQQQAAALQELHHFHCGKCGHKMDTQIFRGVEVEICGNCGAVLLDPGELEQLVGEDRGGVARTIAEFFNFTKEKNHS